ncbi:hypothetical protein IHQ68_17900 [Chelatococcus sambhunathii]|uniref:DUF4417 domain-containing protein n=1 Tax=Chelatococcus sambhunathii TaxID=363953 RepID=A0ABU1DK96_9HYPH|nr:hypothetical protein [Chelatococcus sambhunathii]MDR4308496.1 hypothetical protein [Chelatococcus sambhunathii]
MLTRSEPAVRNPRRERRLWHDESRNTTSLGCLGCRERDLCGLLRMKAAFFDCLQFCCGKPATCDRVCRNHPDYVDRVREVGGFALDNVARAPRLDAPALPRLVPVIFHGNRRDLSVPSSAVALPLYRLLDRKTGAPRFTDHAALCADFGIACGTTIMLTGTDRDPPLERWWQLGEAGRRPIIRALATAGIGLVTTPNYSLFIDRPRWDDLHAMKRIAIVHQEFLAEGMPAALHVNGRTETDFLRWADYVAARPEVSHLAYEFTTGTGWAGRKEQHAAWLAGLAATVGRPLHLVVRGGVEVLPTLASAFAGLTSLDTSIFMKTMMRRRAVPAGNARIAWQRALTPEGTPVDGLFADNLTMVHGWYADMAAPQVVKEPVPA